MKSVVIFVLLAACCHALTEYHKDADKEFVELTQSSIVFFPEVIISNEEEKTIFKVSRKSPTGLFFRPEHTSKQFTFHAARGGIYLLSYYRFDFLKDETILTLLFDLQTPSPHKLMVTSKVFYLPENSPLKEHSENRAVFVSPLSIQDVEDIETQPKVKLVKTTNPLDLRWVKKILEYTPPLMTRQSRSADVQEFLSPPVIIDQEVLTRLQQLQKPKKSKDEEGSS